MNGNGDLRKYFSGLNERLDTITVELVGLKETMNAQKGVQDAMQQTQKVLVAKVGRLESGQERLITLVAKIAERRTDFEAGATVELENVDFNEEAHTLRGNIRRVGR
jgi:hypothetical protein